MDQGGKRIVVRVDPELLEIIPDFLSFRRKDLAMLGVLVEEGDFGKIKIIGHNLKGAGGGFGFDAISDIGQRIEAAAERGSAQKIRACTAELADYLERVEIFQE